MQCLPLLLINKQHGESQMQCDMDWSSRLTASIELHKIKIWALDLLLYFWLPLQLKDSRASTWIVRCGILWVQFVQIKSMIETGKQNNKHGLIHNTFPIKRRLYLSGITQAKTHLYWTLARLWLNCRNESWSQHWCSVQQHDCKCNIFIFILSSWYYRHKMVLFFFCFSH